MQFAPTNVILQCNNTSLILDILIQNYLREIFPYSTQLHPKRRPPPRSAMKIVRAKHLALLASVVSQEFYDGITFYQK